MSYYVYILKSDKDRHYIGYTSDLEKRLKKHNSKHKGFTGTTEIWEIVITHKLPMLEKAVKMEKYLKSLKNSKKAIEYLRDLN